jgi:hypothetical protein
VFGIDMKTSELTGAALDWAVAKCEGVPNIHIVKKPGKVCIYGEIAGIDFPYQPSTDWAQGGPIIEREGINTFKYNKISNEEPDKWCAHKVVPRPNLEGSTNMTAIAPEGPTPLIAAMRCYVASKLGDDINIPEELL